MVAIRYTTATEPREISPFMEANPCPAPGSGVNQWIYEACLSLRGVGWADDEAIGRFVSERATRQEPREIERAVRRSAQRANGTASSYTAQGAAPGKLPKATINHEQVEAIAAGFGGLDQLCSASPAPVAKWTPEGIIDGLFPGNPWLCVGQSKSVFKTRRRDALRGLEGAFQLIVPSPMSRQFGTTQEGKKSEHALDNTGPRRFLVIEFDDLPSVDKQASVLLHLGKRAPLVMVLHSGGKSLHGWFYCHGQDEAALQSFHGYALTLGADPVTWTKSQFVRMPGSIRDNGKKQEVLFLNPAACPGFPSVPTPEGYCPHCWHENKAILRNSHFPCSHSQKRRAS
jgi:hypothetical protein